MAKDGKIKKKRIYYTAKLDVRFGAEGSKKYPRAGEFGASKNKVNFKNQKNEDECYQLARRFGRYKRMRGEALKTIREEKLQNKQQGDYVP